MKTSVVMAVYNGEKYIKYQLDSIMAQTKLPDEIIVCDDNSTDNTIKVVKECMAYAEEKGIEYKIIRNDVNKGYIENFRYAMSLSSGDILFLCDQDDIWEVNKVESLCACFENNKEVQLVASTLRFIDSNGDLIKKEYMPYGFVAEKDALVRIDFDKILEKNFFPGCSMAVDRKVVEKYLSIKMEEKISHDWSIALIAAADNGFFWYNRILLNYRIHENNTLGLAAAGSRFTYIRKTISTWRQYCMEMEERIDFAEKELSENIKKDNYFEHIKLFSKSRIMVINGNKALRNFAKETKVYFKHLRGSVDGRGLALDLLWMIGNRS